MTIFSINIIGLCIAYITICIKTDIVIFQMLIVLREDLTASNIALVSSWPSNTNMSDSEPDYDMVRSETWDFPVDPLVGRGDSYKELQSCFLNPRDFPGRFPASKCVLLFGVPGIAQTGFFGLIIIFQWRNWENCCPTQNLPRDES